jgi:hypothetical protein
MFRYSTKYVRKLAVGCNYLIQDVDFYVRNELIFVSLSNFQISGDEARDDKQIIFLRKRVKTQLLQWRIPQFSSEDPRPPLQGDEKGEAGRVEERRGVGRGGERDGAIGREGVERGEKGIEEGERDFNPDVSDKKIPPVVIRTLLSMYLSHFTSVNWNGGHSHSFQVKNGVRQRAILSPVLFCVFYDVLLRELCSQDMGCHIGSLFVGARAYADDLVLAAPSPNAMRHMLQVCDEYAAQYSVIFNAKKSKCLCCHPVRTPKNGRNSVPCRSFYIGSQAIEFVEK